MPMMKNEKHPDDKPAAGTESSLERQAAVEQNDTAANSIVKKRRTRRRARKAPARAATPTRAVTKTRRTRVLSAKTTRPRVARARSRRGAPPPKVRRPHRSDEFASLWEALFRLAAAVGYRVELRAVAATRGIRRTLGL